MWGGSKKTVEGVDGLDRSGRFGRGDLGEGLFGRLGEQAINTAVARVCETEEPTVSVRLGMRSSLTCETDA